MNKFAKVTGGADKHCLELIDALRSRGHSVAVVSTQDASNEEHAGAFVTLRVTSETRASLSRRTQAMVFVGAWWNGEAFAATTSLLRSFDPHVVHAHKMYPQLSVSPLVAARRLGYPVIQTVHDYEFVSASAFDASGGRIDRTDPSKRGGALNTATYVVRRSVHRRCVTRWIAVSAYVARRLNARGIRADVLPNFAQPVTPRDHVRAGIGFVGRLSPEKGVSDVVALARLMPDIAVTIAGDGPDRPAVEAASAELPNMSYVGRLRPSEVTDLLSSVEIVVMPSRWEEPAGLVALEAMAAGTPVVAYRAGGLAEYVEGAGAGLVVARDVGELIRACRDLLADDGARLSCSERGREAVRTTHSIDRYCESLEPIYEDAQQERRRA